MARSADTPKDKAKAGDGQGVQSVEVSGTVLSALQALGGSASLGEIAEGAGLHRGKIHRYLTSLVRTGLVEQNKASGHYELGPLALSLGLTALRRQNPIASASQKLALLRDETDQSATLAVWGQTGPVVVALEPARRPVSMNVRIG
ncbi:MAG: helix-turn-helix domain-containing protein, partial [Pseudomonadota bacterium]